MTVLSLFIRKLFKEANLRRIIYAVILGAVIFAANSACRQKAYHTTVTLEAASLSEECRVVRQALGETCVPTQPHRIVTLETSSLGNSIALGVQPIGSGSGWEKGGLPEYLQSNVMNIEYIGFECQPNIERILLLKPDLILGSSSCSQNYLPLSKIAPIVLSDGYVNTHWRENFDSTSDVLGKKASAQAIWDQYHKHVEELRTSLAGKQQSLTVAVIDVYASQIFPYTKNSFVGSILNDVGLKMPESQNIVSEFGFVAISDEELQKLDCDILFVMVGNRDEEKFLEKLKQKPLWKKLRAAQTDQIYAVEDYVWWGANPIAANLVLDDLEKYLVNFPKAGT